MFEAGAMAITASSQMSARYLFIRLLIGQRQHNRLMHASHLSQPPAPLIMAALDFVKSEASCQLHFFPSLCTTSLVSDALIYSVDFHCCVVCWLTVIATARSSQEAPQGDSCARRAICGDLLQRLLAGLPNTWNIYTRERWVLKELLGSAINI